MINSEQYFIDEAEDDFGNCLVLKSPWSDGFIDVIKKENISVLRLTESMGWKDTDISFLEKLKGLGLCGVEVYAWDVKDITPLQCLPDLKYIGLQCEFTKAPDFSSFKSLTHFFIYWRPKAKTVFDCLGLSLLNIVNYPSENLEDIKDMQALERLQLTSRKLVSLSGVENLISLSTLDLAVCSKLESLEGVDRCQRLETFELEGCKKISDVSLLAELEYIKNIVLTDCGKIKTLQPLSNCQSLEALTFVGDTNIEDGELSALLKLPQLQKMWYVDKRHYSHKRDQVAELLS